MAKLPPTWAELLAVADAKLFKQPGSGVAKRLFAAAGDEIMDDDYDLIESNDILYLSCGEDWRAPAAAPPPAEKPVPEPKEPPTTVSPPTPPPPGLEPPPAEAAEDPVDLSRLHYGVEDYVKMGVPEEDARAILRAVNKLAKDRDAAQGPPDAAPAADAAAV